MNMDIAIKDDIVLVAKSLLEKTYFKDKEKEIETSIYLFSDKKRPQDFPSYHSSATLYRMFDIKLLTYLKVNHNWYPSENINDINLYDFPFFKVRFIPRILLDYLQEEVDEISGVQVEGNAIYKVIKRIPKRKNYNTVKKMLILFTQKNEIDNFNLAQCLKENSSKKLTRRRYSEGQVNYNNRIKNCFRTLRRFIKLAGYAVKFSKNTSKLIKLNN